MWVSNAVISVRGYYVADFRASFVCEDLAGTFVSRRGLISGNKKC